MRTARYSLEPSLFAQRHDDGLLELFVGVAVLGVGLIWLTPQAGLGGIFPPLLVPLYQPVHTRFVKPRAGRARFGATRQRQEQRGLGWLMVLGLLTLCLGIGTYATTRGGGSDAVLRTLVPGLPAALIGVGGFVAGSAFGLRQLYLHGLVLLAAGAATALAGAHPSAGLCAGGLWVLLAGAVRLRRLFRDTADTP